MGMPLRAKAPSCAYSLCVIKSFVLPGQELMSHTDPEPYAGSAAARTEADDDRRRTTIPSPRTRLARRVLLGAAVAGILADPLLRNEPWGLGLLAWMVVFAAITLLLVRQSGRP